jgi:hypothetical protein
MGKAMNSTRPYYLLRAAMRGEYLSVFFLDLNVAADVPIEADIYDDEGTLFPVERCRVWGGSV